ncbi:Amino acid/amide ABC transporter substrate-binding protein, HAAT family [Bosea sp. LC85]|uniref:ABC transporter substrate-binding protein n=1 Tax=Bosea sp. LC85 TaxID=1502851 RepID=UPI0004E44CBB|nr:ABC transporter substrate-binding protein [Bosea sp. LC85]KFC64719.1 Amino acid/amide ABC transporter substrate-binding protein, HAAT family [Bosea sp. LC85]
MEDCEAHRHDLRLKAGMLRLAAVILFSAAMLLVGAPIKALAQSAAPPAETRTIRILLVRESQDRPAPLSLLDIPPGDDGVAGARLAIADNNNTGRFLGQEFRLDIIESAKADELLAEVQARVAAGQHFLVLDVRPQTVLMLADALKTRDVLLFNAGAPDENLREADCRANVLHTSPSRAMLADALAQYLAWKQWRRWFLVLGTRPEDQAFAEAMRRAAKRFGARIVEERTFSTESGSRRTDGGHEQVQQQIPLFTQNAAAHDVVVVADESELFGEYFPFRTWEARPVVGTQGLTATSWHPALEQWGGTQFQNRFRRSANRTMRPLDYDTWLAVRSIGEAATRRRSTAFAEISAHLRSVEFELAGFKGQRLTFRDWNGQLRQPILIATPKLPVSVSPQPGFLHQFSVLDTLGIDRPETKCRL